MSECGPADSDSLFQEGRRPLTSERASPLIWGKQRTSVQHLVCLEKHEGKTSYSASLKHLSYSDMQKILLLALPVFVIFIQCLSKRSHRKKKSLLRRFRFRAILSRSTMWYCCAIKITASLSNLALTSSELKGEFSDPQLLLTYPPPSASFSAPQISLKAERNSWPNTCV